MHLSEVIHSIEFDGGEKITVDEVPGLCENCASIFVYGDDTVGGTMRFLYSDETTEGGMFVNTVHLGLVSDYRGIVLSRLKITSETPIHFEMGDRGRIEIYPAKSVLSSRESRVVETDECDE